MNQTILLQKKQEEKEMKKSAVLISILIAALLLMLAGCNSSKDATAAKDSNTGTISQSANGPLTVASELAFPPFESKDANGNPVGLEMDFINAFGKNIGRDIKIVDTAWDGLIPSLETGKADIVISSMTITADRAKVVDFSNPYCKMVMEVLVNKNSKVASYNDLNSPDVTIAVKNGTVAHIFAKERWPKAKLDVLDDVSAAFTEVSQGKADACIYDEYSVYTYWVDHQDTTKCITIPVDQQGASGDIGIAVKKGNTELLKQINAFIKNYADQGGFKKLSEKYLPKEQKLFKDLNFTWFFDINYDSYK